MVPISTLDHSNAEAGVSPGSKRATEIAEAAYFLIAEKGFEGLRTREVAERVGINIATLHYHFRTKESLIQAVVAYLMEELRTSRVKTDDSTPALERLQAEFTDIRIRLRQSPQQLVVLTELAMRSMRDPQIAHMLQYLDRGWRDHLISIFKAGIAEKSFRPDLDVESTANAMMNQLRGLGYRGILEANKIDQLVSFISIQTEYWIRSRRAGADSSKKPKRRKTKG
jgi:AcrR family transcriptional regulator